MMAMSDPVRSLQTFTLLVQRAALTGLLDSSSDAFTLFAPNEKVGVRVVGVGEEWVLRVDTAAACVCTPHYQLVQCQANTHHKTEPHQITSHNDDGCLCLFLFVSTLCTHRPWRRCLPPSLC